MYGGADKGTPFHTGVSFSTRHGLYGEPIVRSNVPCSCNQSSLGRKISEIMAGDRSHKGAKGPWSKNDSRQSRSWSNYLRTFAPDVHTALEITPSQHTVWDVLVTMSGLKKSSSRTRNRQ